MLNPDIKITKSKGIDLPILYVYLAGRISGDRIEKCLCWRTNLINGYRNYKIGDKGESTAYPISFLCPLNSGEDKSLDKLGLKSHLPPNLIYDKDLLSVERSDVLVANMDDFFEDDITDLLKIDKEQEYNFLLKDDYDYKAMFFKLQEKIINRRENIGTIMEIGWAFYLKKPVILIVPERRRHIFENHPFTKRASVIVLSEKELIEKKWLTIFYKSIAGASYTT